MSLNIVAISGATTLDGAAVGSEIHCSGASYTVKLPTAAQWAAAVAAGASPTISVLITPACTGLITIQRADGASYLFHGAAAGRIYWAGESFQARWDGANVYAVYERLRAMTCTLRLVAATPGTAQSIPFDGVNYTKVLLTTIDEDNTGLMADIANNQITIKRGGLYVSAGSLLWVAVPLVVGGAYNIAIFKGGSPWIAPGGIAPGTAGQYVAQSYSPGPRTVAAGDAISLQATQAAVSPNAQYLFGSATASGSCFLSMTEKL